MYGLPTSSITDPGPQITDNANDAGSRDSSFLQNSGAIAATFTVVGLLIVGFICAFIVYMRRRKRSEEHDIFESEYKEYAGSGRGLGGVDGESFRDNDMSSLSANGSTFPGSYEPKESHQHMPDYFPHPTITGLPSNRDSAASNHAGYGAHQLHLNAHQSAPLSGLRNESAWSHEPEGPYVEPAVGEDQSIYIVSASYDSRMSDPFHDVQESSVGMAH